MPKIGFEYLKTVPVLYICLIEKLVWASCILDPQATMLKLIHFSKKLGRRSSVGPEILVFLSYYLANFQPILDHFISNFKSKYEDLKI